MRSRPLGKAKGQRRDWSDLGEVAVVDCLTTGHHVRLDRLVWFAAVLMDLQADDDSELTVFETRLDPRIPIPAEATLLHGVATAHVVGQRHFGQVAGKVRDLIGDRPVVGFNVQDTAAFLDTEMHRHGQKTLYRANLHDVAAALRDAWGYSPTISNAVARLGINREEGSGRASNVMATARVARVLARASPEALGNAPGDRWVDEDGDHGAVRATRPQLATIRNLGGDPGMVESTRHAEEVIEVLRPGMPEEVRGSGESTEESPREAVPVSQWMWLAVLGLAALAAWLLL